MSKYASDKTEFILSFLSWWQIVQCVFMVTVHLFLVLLNCWQPLSDRWRSVLLFEQVSRHVNTLRWLFTGIRKRFCCHIIFPTLCRFMFAMQPPSFVPYLSHHCSRFPGITVHSSSIIGGQKMSVFFWSYEKIIHAAGRWKWKRRKDGFASFSHTFSYQCIFFIIAHFSLLIIQFYLQLWWFLLLNNSQFSYLYSLIWNTRL